MSRLEAHVGFFRLLILIDYNAVFETKDWRGFANFLQGG